MIRAGLLTLVVAQRMVGRRWTATLLAGTYLTYRAVAWLLLTSSGFPPSVLPVMLLAGAVLVDLAVTRRVPGWLAAVGVAGGVVFAALLPQAVAVIPPWQWTAVPLAALGWFAVLWGALDRLTGSTAFARWQALLEPAAPPSGAAPVPAGTGGAPAR